MNGKGSGRNNDINLPVSYPQSVRVSQESDMGSRRPSCEDYNMKPALRWLRAGVLDLSDGGGMQSIRKKIF